VRFTYADGINVNNGKRGAVARILVENNHVRGTGDDGIAILSQVHKDDALSTDFITVRRNTVVAPWWASCCDLAGGKGHLIEKNYFEGHGLVVNLPPSYPMLPQGEAAIRDNVLFRCGSDYEGQRRGALWVFAGSTSIEGVAVEGNSFVKPLFHAIDLNGSCEQRMAFRDNLMEAPGFEAVRIGRAARGEGLFQGNRLSGSSAKWLADYSQGNYRTIQKGNSWEEAPK
jgi:hypothetical protein